jgi:hypothetical protein
MEIKESYVFQTDSEIVNSVYSEKDNYLIELNPKATENYCVLYFSSNDLYFPNTELAFQEQLINKNRFEWYGNRVRFASKHIFIRDIQKQWYLNGVNKRLDTPQKLHAFLEEETKGYKVIALGSSAGGFAAITYGQLLHADRIYSFNGQFEVLSLLKKSKESTDPVIFRNQNNPTLLPFFNTVNFITNPSSIYYFRSTQSVWDIEQNAHVMALGINRISFTSSNHGLPFLKSNLPVVLNMSKSELDALTGKFYHPLFFSLKTVGLLKTIEGLNSILQFGLNKVYINTLLKWKTKLKEKYSGKN